MRAAIERFLGFVACRLGLDALARWLHRRDLLIVVYHGVGNGPFPHDMPDWHIVDAREFRRQVEFLARNYRILPIDDAVTELRAGRIGRPTACITFDDGYLNNLTVALPVLREFAAPATVYLMTGLIGTRRQLWTVELETAFRRSDAGRLDLRSAGLGVQDFDGMPARITAARTIGRVLKTCPPEERRQALEPILEQLGDAAGEPSPFFRLLDWDEVATMEDSGLVSFGAHTVNHEVVSQLDDDALAFEMRESIRTVEMRTRRRSRTFAYPNGAAGDFDGRSRAIAADTGMIAALTTIDGLNGTDADPFELRRVTVASTTGFDRFRLETAGILGPLKKLFAPRKAARRNAA